MEKLPELPDLAVNLDKHAAKELAETARCHDAFVCSYGVEGDLHLWTADQMRAYGELCARMAREEAARICEARIPDAFIEAATEAEACAAAIRGVHPQDIDRQMAIKQARALR